MTRKMVHPQKLALFLALSLADLLLTLLLLHRDGGRVYEGNPVAGWWLAAFGSLGLFLFKVLAVLVVVSLSLGISRHRPRLGGALLAFACAAVGLVLLYSSRLVFLCPKDSGQEASLQAESSRLGQKFQDVYEYRKSRDRLCKGLLGRQFSLRQAVQELARTARGRDPQWLKLLRDRYQVDTDEQALGANLVGHALVSERDSPAVENHRQRLKAEYRATFGIPLPVRALGPLAGPPNFAAAREPASSSP